MAADTDGIHVGYNEQGTYDGRYPPDWDARKEAVKQRDHYSCQDCGIEAGEGKVLDVHHTTPLSEGGSNRLRNLELLCVDCHNARHDHDITDGRDDTESTPDVWRWLRSPRRYLIGGVVVSPLHLAALSLLYTQPAESTLRLVGALYFLLLVVVIVIDPGLLAPMYVVPGTIAGALMELSSIAALGPVPMPVIVYTAWLPVVGGIVRWWTQLGDER